MNFLGAFFGLAAAALGRWIQLHPEKLTLQGSYESPHCKSAVRFRALIAAQGTFFVFMGILGACIVLLGRFEAVGFLLALVLGMPSGILAARHVRKEVAAKYQATPGQFGLWP